MNNKILQHSYDKSALTYDKQFAMLQIEKYKIMLRSHHWLNGNKILDLGCGTALLYDFLVQTISNLTPNTDTFEYHGIDFSTRMINIARNKNTPNLKVGNIACLPYPENCFDHVFSFTAIGLSEDNIKDIIAQCYRIIKPKGKLIITLLKKLKLNFIENILIETGFQIVKKNIQCGQDLGYYAKKHRI